MITKVNRNQCLKAVIVTLVSWGTRVLQNLNDPMIVQPIPVVSVLVYFALILGYYGTVNKRELAFDYKIKEN